MKTLEQFERMGDLESALREVNAVIEPFLDVLDPEDEKIYEPSEGLEMLSSVDIGMLMLYKKAKIEFKLRRFKESAKTLSRMIIISKRGLRQEVESVSLDFSVDQEKEALESASRFGENIYL